MRAEEAAQHKEAWKNVVVALKLPSDSMTRQLGSAVAQLDGSGELSKAHATCEQTRPGSPFVATAEAKHNACNIDKNSSGPDAGQDDLNKPQPPSRQGKFGNDETFVDNDNRQNARDANASSSQSSSDNLTRIRMAAARAQAAAVKPQASNSQSSNDRQMAMFEATKRRDDAAKRAGLDARAVACTGRG